MTALSATATVTLAYQSERLRTLHAEYTGLKVAADAAAAALKVVTDALKQELSAVAVGADRIVLPATDSAPALRLARQETWRLDSTRLKRDALETWVRYAKKSESWVLRPIAPTEDGE